MKRLVLFVAVLLSALSCSDNTVNTADCGRHGLIAEKDWFVVKDITRENGVGKVFLISEHGAATCYLVTGTSQAMLIDTGIGVGDLAGLVRGLTDLPLVVVNTHGHPDHMGANYQFSEVWVPVKDSSLYDSMNPFREGVDYEQYVAGNAGDFTYDREVMLSNISDVKAYPKCDNIGFEEGMVWDLGGKTIRTVELGGHTPGSIMFIDETDDILFSGDALNDQLWMWLDTCLSVEEFADNLENDLPKISGVNSIYGGHEIKPSGVPVRQASVMLADVRSALEGVVEAEVSPAPRGEGSIHIYHFDNWMLLAK